MIRWVGAGSGAIASILLFWVSVWMVGSFNPKLGIWVFAACGAIGGYIGWPAGPAVSAMVAGISYGAWGDYPDAFIHAIMAGVAVAPVCFVMRSRMSGDSW